MTILWNVNHEFNSLFLRWPTIVVVAVCMAMDGSGTLCQDIRIALGAVAPAPLRASAAETVLRGNALDEALFEKASLKAREAAEPITDVRGSADYRAALIQTLTRDALRQAKEEILYISKGSMMKMQS